MCMGILVRDEFGNGLPVAFMICSLEEAGPIITMLKQMAAAATRASLGCQDTSESLVASAERLLQATGSMQPASSP